MSAKAEENEVCACCGVAPVDDIQLEECNGGCDLVKYCSDKCCDNYREQHEAECKQQKAELRDKQLFDQPDGTHLGECPICFLPLPIDLEKCRFYTCCCKLVCSGCVYADAINSGKDNCPFCREPAVDSDEENDKRAMERVKVNDPNALYHMGGRHCLDGDYAKAVEYSMRAAKLGDAAAHHNLGAIYYKGLGVEKDEEQGIHHYEKAAIGGHPEARHSLAGIEGKHVNFDHRRQTWT